MRHFFLFISFYLLFDSSYAQIDIMLLDTNKWNVKKAELLPKRPLGEEVYFNSLIISPKFPISKDTTFYFFENQNNNQKNVLTLFYSNKKKLITGCFQGTTNYPDTIFYFKSMLCKDSITEFVFNSIVDTVLTGSNGSTFYAIDVELLKINNHLIKSFFHTYSGRCEDKSIINYEKYINIASDKWVDKCPEYFHYEQIFFYKNKQFHRGDELSFIIRQNPCPYKIEKSKIEKYRHFPSKLDKLIKDTVEASYLLLRGKKVKPYNLKLYKESDSIHPFNGIMIDYYPNSKKILFTKEIRNGSADYGKIIYYYENGQKKEEYSIVEATNIFNGKYIKWFENGQKKEVGKYIYNEKDGKWTEWDEKGNVIKVQIYDIGVLKSEK